MTTKYAQEECTAYIRGFIWLRLGYVSISIEEAKLEYNPDLRPLEFIR